MNNKEVVYFDYNIFEDFYKKDPETCDIVNQAKLKYRLPYSPAHLEDLASAMMWREHNKEEAKDASRICAERTFNISSITDNLEIFPAKDAKPTRLVREHPTECMMRVLKCFDRNRELEVREKHLLESMKANDEDGGKSLTFSNQPIDFLSKPEFHTELQKRFSSSRVLTQNARKAGLVDFYWENICKSHEVLEHVLEILMNYLEELRFRPEPLENSRSRMHDVSHIIYATKSDIFVTRDKRFLHKARVAYNYLKIPTKTMHFKDFKKVMTQDSETKTEEPSK